MMWFPQVVVQRLFFSIM